MVVSARIHPGRVVHVWDHYVVTLRDGGAEHGVSLYDVHHSPELGGGRACLVRSPTEAPRLYADDERLGTGMARRLATLPGAAADLPRAATPASFERRELEGGFGWSIEAPDASVEARWLETRPAIWVAGPAPAFWAAEDIWACFVEADTAAILIDGDRVGGRTFVEEHWRPKLGRSLSSAHVAYAEVRVTPAGDGAEPA